MIIIKIENLEVGMILKNYKELCEVLGVEVISGGNAKKKQIKWFEEYFTYIRDGNKFIIANILNKQIEPMTDKRGGAYNTIEYSKNIEVLILDILAQDKNKGKIFLSKNKLFHLLEMVNVNYLDCNRTLPKLSKFLEISEDSVQEWFDTTNGLLERSLGTALKKLANQSLIFWSREITVCKLEAIEDSECWVAKKHKDEYGDQKEQWVKEKMSIRTIREATDEEKQYILEVERDTILKLECDDKQEIIKKGLWSEFEERVKEILTEECDIVYYYQSYKILFNPEHILKKQNQIKDLLLNNKERIEQKSIVNVSLMERIEGNADSRKNNAIKDSAKSEGYNSKKESTLLRRSKDTYVDDTIKLNKTLIDKDAKDVRYKIKKTKVDD